MERVPKLALEPDECVEALSRCIVVNTVGRCTLWRKLGYRRSIHGSQCSSFVIGPSRRCRAVSHQKALAASGTLWPATITARPSAVSISFKSCWQSHLA